MAAITNTRGQLGLVIDLTAGKVTMELRRGAYCAYAGNYPLAFFELDGRLLLVHGTEWNRLDVSDPLTGEILTARTFVIPEGAKYPEHGLDYFHCSLSVSPNHEWIVDNGWVWQPFGVPTAWNLRRWVHENVWESEDGPTKRRLSQDFDWDAPCCWIEDRTVVLWGYQDSFNPPIDAVRIYDVTTGRMLRWFAGPAGKLAFDGYLFSYSDQHGTSVWDITTGERLLRDDTFHPACYHHGAHCFLSTLPDGAFQLSRLKRPGEI